MEIPATHYAWNGDVSLAYQILGDGPIDLIYYQGYCSHVDMNWESPRLSRFLRGLARHSRLIITDRRGWGCSDRFSPSDVPPIEAFTDDLIAVMDAVGSERAVIFATSDCGLIAPMFAATHPDRATGLILCDAWVTFQQTEETPWMYTAEEWEGISDEVHRTWGGRAWAEVWSEGQGTGERELDWFARYQRASVAPGALIAETRRFLDNDIRPVLPSVHVPTLVFGEPDDSRAAENGRYLASRIMGARLVELSSDTGGFHWYGRADAIIEEVGRFLGEIGDEEASFSRQLATVMFTDIVGSTRRAAQLGDSAWKVLLERHHETVRAMIGRYRGMEIDTAGDGFLATFDGPARGVKCAQAIAEAVLPLGLEIRAGVHTGEVETIDGKVGGIAVHIGARVGAAASASEVLVSSTVKDLVAGSGLTFEDAGEHELKGVPDRWHLYRVVGS